MVAYTSALWVPYCFIHSELRKHKILPYVPHFKVFQPLFIQDNVTETSSLLQEYPDHIYTITDIHTWKLANTTTVWPAGREAAPLGYFGLRDTADEGKCCLFTCPT